MLSRNQNRLILPTRRVLQGIDLWRFKLWNKVVPIFTKGEYPDGRQVSRHGILPYEAQYLDKVDSKGFANVLTPWTP
ncbi:hypothetical protein NKDENANG_03735 [Candidatus Entotheonellaceae bacterium PAL068K]